MTETTEITVTGTPRKYQLARELTIEEQEWLDARLDEALDESFPASDPPAVHSIELTPTPSVNVPAK